MKQIEAEAVPYWQEAENNFLGQMSGNYAVDSYSPPQTIRGVSHLVSDTRKSIHYTLDMKDGSVKVVPTYENVPTYREAFVVNPDYRFRVSADGPSSRYKLTDFDPAAQGGIAFFERFRTAPAVFRESITRLLAAEAFNGLRLDQLVRGERGYKITSAQFVNTDAGQRCQLEFDFPPLPKPNGAWKGAAILNPADHWAVERWDTVAPTWRLSYVNTLQHTADGMPFPKTSIETSTKSANGELVRRVTSTFDLPQIMAKPPVGQDDFTLAAFDLPVPGKVSGNSKWVILNVVGLCVLGLVLAVLRGRRRTGTTPAAD